MVGEGKAAPVKFELKKPALSTLAQRQRSARLRRDPPAEGRPVSRPSALADPATLGNEGQAGAEAGMFAMLDRIEVKITDTLRKTSGSLAARKRSEPAAAAGGANGLPASGTGSTSRAKPGGSSAVPAAGRSGAFPCLRLRLLPTYLAIEEAGLALPYSAETLRFLRQVEAGRLPWHYLRSLPKLWEHVEKMFMEGCLDVEVRSGHSHLLRRARTNAHMRSRTHARMHAQSHARTHTCVRALACTHAHTRTCAHEPPLPLCTSAHTHSHHAYSTFPGPTQPCTGAHTHNRHAYSTSSLPCTGAHTRTPLTHTHTLHLSLPVALAHACPASTSGHAHIKHARAHARRHTLLSHSFTQTHTPLSLTHPLPPPPV